MFTKRKSNNKFAQFMFVVSTLLQLASMYRHYMAGRKIVTLNTRLLLAL